MRSFFAGLALVLFVFPVSLQAAELIMLEQQGCVYCQKWHEEIGTAYPNTSEGKKAPLRIVDIHQPIPEDLSHVRIERFTPTFILLDEGREVGRIRGYPGDEFFWFLLQELLAEAEGASG